MAKTTIKTDLDFTLNPDNIAVGDWVASKIIGYDKVGQIHGYATQNKGMLKFWVMWSGQQSTSSELADNLQKIEPLERDYVGEELKNGRVRYLHYLKEEDRVIAEVCINGETDYWNIDKLQFNLNNLNSNETVDLDTLIIDKNLQQRVKINNDVVNDYCEAYKKGEKLPPITIWHCTDDGKTYLVDGFHRAEASLKAGLNHLPFLKFEGTYREALLFTLGVNAKHGLRRSNADKRKAVMTLLLDPEWTGWSDRQIAKKCAVSNTYVSNLRSKTKTKDNPTVNVDSEVTEETKDNPTVNVDSEVTEETKDNPTVNVDSEVTEETKHNPTVNVDSEVTKETKDNPTVNVSSGVAENNNNDSENDENKRTYINKDGIKTTMDVSNIGKSKKPEITPNNFAPNNEAQLNADLWNADNPNKGYR